MKRVTTSTELDKAILKLKAQKEMDFAILKDQLSYSYQELRPYRIAKRLFTDLKKEPKIKDNILQSILSLAAGYLSKRILIGKSNTFFKSILGYLVQIGATKIVSDKIITDDK